jgi:hypothetical protein
MKLTSGKKRDTMIGAYLSAAVGLLAASLPVVFAVTVADIYRYIIKPRGEQQ